MLFCCLFFSSATSFDFGCCSLAQEMSFVDRYLLYFRQWLITHPLSAHLTFQPLFTLSSHENQLLAPPPFSGALRAPRPSAVCSFSVPCLLFSCLGFFAVQGVSLYRGLCWFIPGVAVGIHLFVHLLICWMSPKQVWSWRLAAQEPSCFLSVMWHRESLYGLGVQGVKALIPLGAFFLPSVAPGFQQNF
jgi:hypothetical protein